MSVNILLKRSATASKRPVGASMAFGELNLNYDAATGGLFYKDTNGDVVKVGPCQVSATAPNSTPAGSTGNSEGEFWFDTSTQTLKIYDGSGWVETGGAVQGVTGTAPITVDNTDPLNPVIGIDAASTTAAGAVQLNDSTSSTSTIEAATANAVKTAFDAAGAAQTTADAALPKAGGTMTGDITFNAGQVFPGTVTSVTAVVGSAVTVDNTDPTQPILDVASASTTAPGVVQLNNSTTSTSTTEALTAAQGKVLQDEIDALAISSNLTLAGTFDASTGLVDSVTSAGTAAGFTVGAALPAPAAGNTDYFVIVDVQGSTGPSGTPPYHIGDWFLSDGTSWQFLNIGFQAPYATTTTEGVVQLATDAEVQAGVNTDHAVVPSSLQSKLSDSTSTTSSTTIASSTAVKAAYDLADAALPKAGGTMTGNLYISNSELQVDSTGIFTSAGSATFTGTTDLNGATSFFFTPTWLENIGPAAQVTYDNTTSGLAAIEVQAAIDEVDGIANAAMPKTGGNFTGNVTFDAGTNLTVDVGANFLMDGSASFSGSTNFEGTSVTNFLTGSAVTFESSLTIGSTGSAYTFPAADGAANYILATDGAGVVSWVAQSAGDVTGVTGTAPITVDNTDPQNPVVGISAASTTAAGAVQLNNTVTSTSTTEAATANAVKLAYDTAVAAAATGSVNGITSDTVIFVNCTDGNNTTGQRGTTKPFLTITAALAAAQENDTIFLSPGTFTENVTLTKGVNMIGTLTDQALGAGTKILGNFVVNATASMTKNWAIRDIYFISPNSTPPFSITANSFGAGGLGSVTNCDFTQATSSDPTQYAVVTSGTWTRSVYFRECTFDGNFHHNAGTAAGASGYVVIDRLLGVGNSAFYNRITTGTAEFRNPSNSLASVFQTGGVVLINGAASGITASGAGLNSVFGSSGFSYKGSAASVGTGTVYFSGESQGTGKIDLGANLIYGYTNLIMDPANLTVSGSAVAYTTAVPSAANAQTLSQQRPRLDLLKTTSSVTAANQLATVVDSATGALYTVASLDAGTY